MIGFMIIGSLKIIGLFMLKISGVRLSFDICFICLFFMNMRMVNIIVSVIFVLFIFIV